MAQRTSDFDRQTVHPSRLSAKVLAPAAVFSVLTSPITAVWFLLLGQVVLMLTVITAVVIRDSWDRSERVFRMGASVGLGLLVGPLLYVGLAVANHV